MEYAIDQWVVDAITRHGPALERSIRSLVRNDEEAADICQEVAVRLLIATRNGSPPDVPAAWMQRVARNLVINAARRRAVARRADDRLHEPTVIPGIDLDVLDLEQQEALRSALEAARDVERDVILLAAGGLPTREIADQLGRSELATRALLCRARAKVRRQLILAGVLDPPGKSGHAGSAYQRAKSHSELPGDRGPAVNPLPRGLTMSGRSPRLHSAG